MDNFGLYRRPAATESNPRSRAAIRRDHSRTARTAPHGHHVSAITVKSAENDAALGNLLRTTSAKRPGEPRNPCRPSGRLPAARRTRVPLTATLPDHLAVTDSGRGSRERRERRASGIRRSRSSPPQAAWERRRELTPPARQRGGRGRCRPPSPHSVAEAGVCEGSQALGLVAVCAAGQVPSSTPGGRGAAIGTASPATSAENGAAVGNLLRTTAPEPPPVRCTGTGGGRGAIARQRRPELAADREWHRDTCNPVLVSGQTVRRMVPLSAPFSGQAHQRRGRRASPGLKGTAVRATALRPWPAGSSTGRPERVCNSRPRWRKALSPSRLIIPRKENGAAVGNLLRTGSLEPRQARQARLLGA